MATNYGLTDNGFILPSLSALIDETKTSLKAVFGENFNTQSNTVADKLTSILNEREYQIYLLMSMIFSAQTLQGAEGIYLDDLLGKLGVFRQGETKGSGSVEMTLNATVPYNMIYSVPSWDIDSGNFVLAQDTPVAGNIIAQRILNTDLVTGNYTFTIQNQTTQNTQTLKLTLTTTAVGTTALNSFYASIKQFIVDNTILSNEDLILIDTVEGSIYIGYDTQKNLVGLNSRVDFRTSPVVGNKTITMNVVAVDAGAISREVNTVTSINPTPSGFVAMTNLKEFASGSDVESDNEYRLRAANISSSSGKATRPAVLSALLSQVSGIEKVRIFANNTGVTDSNGIPPYKFETVVYGGATEDISEVLYNTIAVSNATYGTTFYDIVTEDNQIERIYHTKAQSRQLELRITYKGKVLSTTEQTDINTALINLVEGLSIADTLYNIQLISTVGATISSGRFTSVTVEVKDLADPDSAYTTADVVANIDEVFALNETNINYVQVI